MKKIQFMLMLTALLCGQLVLAQDNAAAEDWKPASSNQPGKAYPQVNSKGRVKFRIVAPEATDVGCTFRDSGEFTKGEDGAWYGTTRPLDEGFHYYISPETAHEWQSWRRSLREFAPLLFND